MSVTIQQHCGTLHNIQVETHSLMVVEVVEVTALEDVYKLNNYGT